MICLVSRKNDTTLIVSLAKARTSHQVFSPAQAFTPVGRSRNRNFVFRVRKEIGALAVPDEIHFTAALPKTRSGKIMRRLLRDVAAGRETKGDTSTLEEYSVLARLRTQEE